MATKASPRSNSSSASSSSSRKNYNNVRFIRERDGITSDRYPNFTKLSTGFTSKVSLDSTQQQNRAQWGGNSSQSGRGSTIQGSRGGKWAETEGADASFPITERKEERTISWRSNKQEGDNHFAGGRSKGIQPSNKAYPNSRDLQSVSRGQPSTWKEDGAIRGSWNQPARPQGEGIEQVRRSQNTNIPEQRRWETYRPNVSGKDAYASSEATSTNYVSKLPSFKNTTGFASEARIEHNNINSIAHVHENPHTWRNRGWESPGSVGVSTNRRFDGYGSAVPQLATRGDWRQNAKNQLDVRKGRADGSMLHVGQSLASPSASEATASVENRRFDGYGSAAPQLATRGDWRQNTKNQLDVRKGRADGSMSHVGQSLALPSSSARSGGSQKEATASVESGRSELYASAGSQKEARAGQASVESGRSERYNSGGGQKEATGQASVGSGRSERYASGEAQSAVTPKGHQGSLPPRADSEELDDAMLPFVVGSCEDMCPVKEREQRERLRDLAVFERLNGNPHKTSRELAVKKFCRTFSGMTLQAVDVRPLPILWNTLQYLLNLLDDHEYSFDVVHNFLFDRTRAIRQELSMQRIANSQAITMYENIVRFHILSEHELNQRGSGRSTSDSYLNLQQLSKSLTSLFDLYHLKSGGISKNEAEFRAYYVLLNLGSLTGYQAESLSIWFRQFPSAFLHVPEMKLARKVLRCYRLGNFKAFFQLALGATFLQGCLLELHFNEVRLKSLVAINQGGYKLHPIPLRDISKLLLMKEGDLEELCNLCGLSTGLDNCRVRCLLAKQSQFSQPKEIPCYRCPFLLNKRALSFYEEVIGASRNT